MQLLGWMKQEEILLWLKAVRWKKASFLIEENPTAQCLANILVTQEKCKTFLGKTFKVKLQWSFHSAFCNCQNTVSPSKVPPIINEEREKHFRRQFWALAAGSWTTHYSDSACFSLLTMERSGSSALQCVFCRKMRWGRYCDKLLQKHNCFQLKLIWSNRARKLPWLFDREYFMSVPSTWCLLSWVAESKTSLHEKTLKPRTFFSSVVCKIFMTGNGLNPGNVRETKEAKLELY